MQALVQTGSTLEILFVCQLEMVIMEDESTAEDPVDSALLSELHVLLRLSSSLCKVKIDLPSDEVL